MEFVRLLKFQLCVDEGIKKANEQLFAVLCSDTSKPVHTSSLTKFLMKIEQTFKVL